MTPNDSKNPVGTNSASERTVEKKPWVQPTLRRNSIPEVTQAAANTMGDVAGSS